MLELWKTTTLGQFEAALCTLGRCIDACPDEAWDAPVANLSFCQAAFHALFFVDCYLSVDTDAMLAQAFHREHAAMFRDYEEMEDRAQVLMYSRDQIGAYMGFCREKAVEVITGETEETLAGPSGFYWLEFPRAGIHMYNLRHIQHHAAALSLRLRLDHGIEIRWVKDGWMA
ncbi:MAG: hypothetical protein AAGG07_01025 [Planctomycetota bacterium]